MTAQAYREFLLGWDGEITRVVTVGDELVPVQAEPMRPGVTPRKKIDVAPFAPGVTASAPGCGLCTWAYRDGRWALKYVHRGCRVHAA
ncbi:MAG: hypothetical protein WAK28_15785 [Trebonia sp.]